MTSSEVPTTGTGTAAPDSSVTMAETRSAWLKRLESEAMGATPNSRLRDSPDASRNPLVSRRISALGLTAAPSIVIRVGDREAGRFSGPLDAKAVLAAIDAAK